MSISNIALPGTALAVTNLVDYQSRIYYQDAFEFVREVQDTSGDYTIDASPIIQAAFDSPLATISWQDGDEIRLYLADEDNILQEYGWSIDTPSWTRAVGLGDLQVKVGSSTHLAAIRFIDSQGTHIRVYCQDSNNNIIEVSYEPETAKWTGPGVLPIGTPSLSGSDIAAVSYFDNDADNTLEIRVYYQGEDLSVRELAWVGSNGWSDGAEVATPSEVMDRTPISAVGWSASSDVGAFLRVFWVSNSREINVREYNASNGWNAQPTSVAGPISSFSRICASQFDSGAHLRVYYQSDNSDIIQELRNDGNGWASGTTITTGN